MPVSACIPCQNNVETLARCIESLRAQHVEIDDLIVIDDGSSDGSAELAERLGARVVRHPVGLGRGAARARGIEEARHDLVLSCDATNILAPDFADKALRWFEATQVAAVCGVIRGFYDQTAADRWRNRHLFKSQLQPETHHGAPLITYGVVLRRSAVLATGNFNKELRFAEDADLGRRLLAAGYDVISDPEVVTISIARNSALQVLERYWRWNMDNGTSRSFHAYLRHIAYACKVMARDDLRQNDWAAAFLSLLSPHYPLIRRLGFHR